MANFQVGTQLRTQRPPKFANCVVRGGTWTEKDATKTEPQINENEETFNYTGWDPGIDAKCELFPKAGFEIGALDVLVEIETDTPRSWLVATGPEKKNFGKRALIYSVELVKRDALDTTLVS